MNRQKTSLRFYEIDLIRGLAICGMIMFHALFIANLLNVTTLNLSTGFWHYFARLVQFTFITLVGVSAVLSFKAGGTPQKRLKRIAQIALCALTVNIATYLAIPDAYVIFGILHLIAAGLLLSFPLINRPKLALCLGIFTILITLKIQTILTSSIPAFIFGFANNTISSIDYFPLFPWLSLVFFGIPLGHYLHKKITPKLTKKRPSAALLILIGQRSLLIYMLHVPPLLGLVYVIKQLLT